MAEVSIFVELEADDPESRFAADTLMGGLQYAYGTVCTGLKCDIHRVAVGDIVPNIEKTVRLTRVNAADCLKQHQVSVCVYIATRNLVIPWGEQDYEMVTYIVSTANVRAVLGTVLYLRGPWIPTGALEVANQEINRVRSLFPEEKLTEDETRAVGLLTKAFNAGVDVAEALWERHKSELPRQ